MKTLSVFVAGAKNLQPLRLRLKAMANDLNSEFKQRGLDASVNMVSYENFGDEQRTYNKFITEEADMVIYLLEDRIGKKTEEEYLLTIQNHKKNGRPEYCVFLHEFNERTDDIAHIEELMSSTSNKYYVNYSNTEDLLAKAKTRITDLAMKKKGFKPALSKKKKNTRRALIAGGALLLLIAAARLVIGPLNTNFISFDFEFPNSLKQKGINSTYAEKQLLHTIQEESINAQQKVNHILNDSIKNNATWNIAFPKTITTGNFQRIRNGLRKLFGCHDLKANLHFIESGNSIQNNLFITDWNDKDYHYSSEINTDADQFDELIATAFRKDAAYLSFPYNPIVSVLYDYNFLDELQEYQMVSPWQDGAFQTLDREVILTDFAQTHHPNAPIATLLLGNGYESYGLENSFEKNSLAKAIDYYNALKDDPIVAEVMQQKIETLDTYINSASTSNDMNMVERLEKNGAFQTKDCKQMVIIGNEERLVIDGKEHFNATLYTYEKDEDGSWKPVFSPFVVHLGVKGLAEPNEKKEGDLKTPSGYYALPLAFGKKNDLDTKFNFLEISQNHVWVSDTTSSQYNIIVNDVEGKYINTNVNEKLYRNDALYDYAIVIDYNTNPVVVGKGSAIFMHIERFENHRTAGCVSMSREEIVQLIKWLDSSKNPHVYLSKSLGS